MSAHLPLRRLAGSASTMLLSKPTTALPIHFSVQHIKPLIPRRTLFGFLKRRQTAPPIDPLSAEYLSKKQKKNSLEPADAALERGDLASGSIFEDGSTDPETGGKRSGREGQVERDPALMRRSLNPNPSARARWQRKMVIRSITQRGRISKTTLIARNERQHLSKSHFIKTSIKKLMPLARQIAGKSVNDAIVQMRFSKKQAAKDVLNQLERARDEAIVVRGMGLGAVRTTKKGEMGVEDEDENVLPAQKMLVIDKKGKRRLVSDRTQMYVDQAWVGRGTPDYGVDYRAKGRAFRLTRPFTSISLVLKEEATRIRLMNEREDKAARKKPWVPLPDRPVTVQKQYPLW